jgi:hypothetical protein
MKFVLFIVALGSACLGVMAWIFRAEVRAWREARRVLTERVPSKGVPQREAEVEKHPADDPPKRSEGEKKPPAPKRTNGMVSGVSYANEDGTDRQAIIRKHCQEGAALTLVREQDNPRDRNAVAIYVGRSQIGYVSSEDAPRVAKCLDEGWSTVASVVRIYGGTKDKPSLGVNFLIVQTPA